MPTEIYLATEDKREIKPAGFLEPGEFLSIPDYSFENQRTIFFRSLADKALTEVYYVHYPDVTDEEINKLVDTEKGLKPVVRLKPGETFEQKVATKSKRRVRLILTQVEKIIVVEAKP